MNALIGDPCLFRYETIAYRLFRHGHWLELELSKLSPKYNTCTGFPL